jgi:hypothetical protein
MEDLLRKLEVVSFYIFFILATALIGLLFDLHDGALIGLLFSVLVLAFFFKYSEKIVLLLSKARYITDDEELVNQVKNFCTHLGIKEIKLYWSGVYVNNIYFVNSYGGTASIIIGKSVYLNLSKNEINSLLYATLLRIKTAESKHRTIINVVVLLLFSWVFIVHRLINKERKIKGFIRYYLYPAFYIKNLFYMRAESSDYFDELVFINSFLKRDYVSAIFKVSKLESLYPLSAGAFVLSGLTHVKNFQGDFVSYVLFAAEKTIETRAHSLVSKLE